SIRYPVRLNVVNSRVVGHSDIAGTGFRRDRSCPSPAFGNRWWITPGHEVGSRKNGAVAYSQLARSNEARQVAACGLVQCPLSHVTTSNNEFFQVLPAARPARKINAGVVG